MKKSRLLVLMFFLLISISNCVYADTLSEYIICDDDSFYNYNKKICSDKYDLSRQYIFLDNKNEEIYKHIKNNGDNVSWSSDNYSINVKYNYNDYSFDLIWLNNTKGEYFYIPENTSPLFSLII